MYSTFLTKSIFCENNRTKKCIVLVVELKSDNSDDWHRQAKAGITYAKYLIGMLEGYHKINLSAKIEYRGLLFHTKKETSNTPKMPKRKIKKKGIKYNEHPIFNYSYTDSPCNFPKHYLELFIQNDRIFYK